MSYTVESKRSFLDNLAGFAFIVLFSYLAFWLVYINGFYRTSSWLGRLFALILLPLYVALWLVLPWIEASVTIMTVSKSPAYWLINKSYKYVLFCDSRAYNTI